MHNSVFLCVAGSSFFAHDISRLEGGACVRVCVGAESVRTPTRENTYQPTDFAIAIFKFFAARTTQTRVFVEFSVWFMNLRFVFPKEFVRGRDVLGGVGCGFF